MDPRLLFDQARSLWPDAIVLSSDAGWEEGKPIWSIVEVYDAIDELISADDWLSIAAWSFHQALWDLAKPKIEAGGRNVRPADVTFEAFDSCMRSNLLDDSWTDFRTQYDPDLKS